MRKIFVLLSLMVLIAGSAVAKPCTVTNDVTGDDVFDGDDPKFLLVYLFDGGAAPVCSNQADANGDGQVDASDAVTMINLLNVDDCAAARLGDVDDNNLVTLVDVNYLLNYLFLNGPPPTPCDDPADANFDGTLSLGDAVAITQILDCPGVHGDGNSDERINLADALIVTKYLFVPGSPEPFPCPLASDFNGDGRVDIADMIGIFDYIY